MCIICTKEYDENTKEIRCCREVSEIPATLINLNHLYCHHTQITCIPPTLTNLVTLYCPNTQITCISPTLINLRYLYCENTQITCIPATLTNLTELYCSNTQITCIPPTLTNLVWLYCGNTQITYIPSTLTNLGYITYDDCRWFDKWYKNKEDWKRQLRKIIILQRLWRWKKVTKTLPVCRDLREYVIKQYYLSHFL